MSRATYIFIIILLFQVISGKNEFRIFQNDSPNIIRCLMLRHFQDPCVVLGGKPIPHHLIQVFRNLPERVQNIIKSDGMFSNLTAEEYKNIPINYWLVIPVDRLSKLSGHNLSSLLLAYPQETSIAAQVILALKSSEQRNSSLISLTLKKDLSDDVKDILAEGVSKWKVDTDWNYQRVLLVGSPLLAHFPPYHLFTSPNSLITKFLFFFQSWDNVGNSVWLTKPKLIQRVWAHLFFKYYHLRLSDWSQMQMNRLQFLLPGMIPDELRDLKNGKNLSDIFNKQTFFKMDFDMQQTQLLFDMLYQDKILTKRNFLELSNLLMKLSPVQLQKFPINLTNFRKLDIVSNILYGDNDFTTMKQLTQMIIAELKLAGKLKSIHSLDWGSSIRHIGACVYTLSLHEIRQLSRQPPDVFALEAIESSKLSYAQIYYLTRNGTSLEADKPTTTRSMKWMLRGLPTSNIRNISMVKISSSIWLNLLSNLPGDNVPRSLGFLKHIIHHLSDTDSIHILERLFMNPSVEDYFKIIPSIYLKNITKMISDNFNELQSRYRNRVMRLPDNVLSLLLDENRLKSWIWNDALNSTISLRFLFRGLTCYDVEKLDVSEFIYVMSQYNKERKEVGQVFPKNLQHCCYEKLFKYLRMKSQIMQEDPNDGLVTLLEPGEIEAVGGYILSNLPTTVISASKYRKNILTLIGKLTMPELLIAISKQRISDLVELASAVFRNGDEFGNREFLQMGNFVLFLPPEFLIHVQPETLKLIIELNFTDRRLCADRKTRSAWANIITKAYGKPETWTEGVIVSLNDFLLVVDDEILNRINKSTWLKVAEPLKFRFGDNIEWWKDDIPFYEACMDILDASEHINYLKELEKLARWQLKLAQWKLDTIKTANDILLDYEKPGLRNKKVPVNILHHFVKGYGTKVTALDGNKTEICSESCENHDKIKHIETFSTHVSDIIQNVTGSYGATKLSSNLSRITTALDGYNFTTVSSFSGEFSPSNFDTSTSVNLIDGNNESTIESLTVTSSENKLWTEKEHVTQQTKPSTSSPSKKFWDLWKPFSFFENNDLTEKPVAVESTTGSDIRTTLEFEIQFEETDNSVSTTTDSIVFDDSSVINKSDYHLSTTVISDLSYQKTIPSNHVLDSSENNEFISQITTELSTTTSLKIFADDEMKPEIIVEDDHTNSHNPEMYNYKSSKKYHEIKSEITTALSDSSNLYSTHGTTIKNIEVSSGINSNDSEMVTNSSEKYNTDSSLMSPTLINNDNTEAFSEEHIFPSTTLKSENKFQNLDNAYSWKTSEKPTEFSNHKNEITTSSDHFFDPVADYYSHPMETENKPEVIEDPVNRLVMNIIPIGSEQDDNYNLFEYAPADDYYNYHNDFNLRLINKRNTNGYDRSGNGSSITCDALRVVGSYLHLIFNETHLNKMSDEEIKDCFEVFGSMDLPQNVRDVIWKKIIDKEFHLMGSLLKAVKLSDIDKMNFSFNEPWLLEKLYSLSKYAPNMDVMKKIIEKVFESNDIEIIDPEILASLNHLICYMKSDVRKRILSKANDNSLAISVLGKITHCSVECIQDLAEFAMDEKNYGSPNTWDLYDMISLGTIPAGLKTEDWVMLLKNDRNAIMGLQPSAVKCLSLQNLLAIPPELFRLMPYKTLMVVFREKHDLLIKNQMFAINQIMSFAVNTTEHLLPIGMTKVGQGQDVNLGCIPDQSVSSTIFAGLCIYILVYIL